MRVKVLFPFQGDRAGGALVPRKYPGSWVTKGEPLAGVQCRGGTVTVPAPDSGWLVGWNRGSGEWVQPGAELAQIERTSGAAQGYLLPVDPIRLQIRRILEMNATVPQIASMIDVDMSRTMALRVSIKEEFQRGTGVPLGFMPFFIRAAVEGLQAVPVANASLTPQGLWLHDRIHMGVSVSTPMGAQVPIIRDPDRKTVTDLALELHDKAQRARLGMLRTEEVVGSTFGLSNPGSLGTLRSVPAVLPPHVATMTCDAIVQQPVAVGGRVEVRPVMSVTISYDHRALDGDEAGTFLRQVKSCLEQAQFEF